MADKDVSQPAAAPAAPAAPTPPLRTWLPVIALAWAVPGGGHFMLGRRMRGALLLGSVLIMFALGLMMRGAMFTPQSEAGGRFDLFTTVINWGGFVGNLASGVLYLLTVMLGYAQPDVAGHTHDYGTKFLVCAGLLNVLAMVDAFEIVSGKKS
jgi:hypothetical protein